jgi:membrane protease YdiL (CAAX protease family)
VRPDEGENPLAMATTSATSGLRPLLRRHPVLFGFVLMFACTWPIDLWAAAGSRGWVSVAIPPVLPILVGYGFVIAALTMTAILDGRAGVGALLRRFLVWRFGVVWYAVVLLGPFAVDLAGIGIDVLLHGTVPAFDEPFINRILGPSFGLAVALPVFFLIDAVANGEEIGWRGYALPRLQARHSALVASVVIGIVWAVWHLPKFLTAGSTQSYPFWLFVLGMVASAIIYTWVFNSTGGSLLSVTLLHAAFNTSAISLPVLPAVTGDDNVVVTTVVLRCVIAAVIVAVAGAARLTRSPHRAAVAA